MGPMDVPSYDEDCLTLNVWTPTLDRRARLPVFVWFHGGGFMFGAGSAGWYDGSVMARRGSIVVVTINYRLGALGWLYMPPGVFGRRAAANQGLQDQCQALEWVRRNIDNFGGDPGTVTIGGQSAGSLSSVALHAAPRAKGLFKRAILQSGPPSIPPHSIEAAAEITRLFCDTAGTDARGLRSLSANEIVKCQMATLMRIVNSVKYDPRLMPALAMSFQFVVDGDVLPLSPIEAARRGSMDKTDLLIMCTPEEMRMNFAFDERWWSMDRQMVLAALENAGGKNLVDLYNEYERLQPETSAPAILTHMITDWTCTVPSIELAERRASIGRPAYFAWFTFWSKAAGGRLGPCHTIELPFVFNNIEQHWTKAPMLAGTGRDELQALANKVQDAWTAFIRHGNPGAQWLAYAPPECFAMEFGQKAALVKNPAGRERALFKNRTRSLFSTSTIFG